jgi:hypothetical protein
MESHFMTSSLWNLDIGLILCETVDSPVWVLDSPELSMASLERDLADRKSLTSDTAERPKLSITIWLSLIE